jgi:hypothetical protein
MTLGEAELEMRRTSAQAAATAAWDENPAPRDWGLFSVSDAPAGIGGGVGAFLWFDSESDVLNFIEAHIAFHSPGPITVDVEALLLKVGAIVDKFKAHEIDYSAARLQLNSALEHFSQIQWWGATSDLLSADSEFPRRVRSWFRGNRGVSDSSDDPISEPEREAFWHSLVEYGM